MLSQTAQAGAHIQYLAPISTPSFAEKRRIEQLEVPYLVWLSDYKPESEIQLPTFASRRWSATPTSTVSGELLYWDLTLADTPDRPSGKLAVTLESLGRGTPMQIHEFWDL